MALWGSSRPNDLQSRIDDIQAGLVALGEILGDGASRAGKGAVRGAKSTRDTISSTAEDVSGALAPTVSDLKSQIESLMSIAGAVTGSLARSAGRETKDVYKAVETKVEDHAMLALVAAAGVGFLLGAVLLGASGSSGDEPRRAQRPRNARRARAPARRRAA